MTALAAAAWQGWNTLQQSELIAAQRPLSARMKVGPPVFEPENITFSATSPSSKKQDRTPTQIVLDSMATHRPLPPQQPAALKVAEQIDAKPVADQPSAAGKPQTAKPQAASPAANINSSKNQVNMQQSVKMSAPIQPVLTTVVTPPVTQPVASAVAPPIKEDVLINDTATPPPEGDIQPSDPVNAQP